MSYWNYRILARKTGAYVEFAIYEVHYNDEGILEGFTENSMKPSGYDSPDEEDPIKSIQWQLDAMKLACDKPVLDYDNFPNEYKKEFNMIENTE